MQYFLLSRFFKRDKNSILVFQTAEVGDGISTSPVFREIKRAYPSTRLGIIVDPIIKEFLEHNPHLDEIIDSIDQYVKGVEGVLWKVLGKCMD